MATRKIIDIEQNGEKVWPKGHAKATFMSNGTTVEDAINSIQTGTGGGVVSETDPIFSASPAASITEEKKAEWDSKQDKLVSGTNIKTINGDPILGDGNITIEEVAPYITDFCFHDLWFLLEGESIECNVPRIFRALMDNIPIFVPIDMQDNPSDFGYAILDGSADTNYLNFSVRSGTHIVSVRIPSAASEIRFENITSRITLVGTEELSAFVSQFEVGKLYIAKIQGFIGKELVYALPDAATGDENDILLSRDTVKTFNGESIFGRGDITIKGGSDVEVPTKVSQLENDAEYITQEDVAKVAISGSYKDLHDTPTIPTKTSELANDNGLIDEQTLSTTLEDYTLNDAGYAVADGIRDSDDTIFYLPSTAPDDTDRMLLTNGFLKTINGQSIILNDGADDVSVAYPIVTTSSPAAVLQPNAVTKWDAPISVDLSLSFAEQKVQGYAAEYIALFTVGADGVQLIVPDGVVWADGVLPAMTNGKTYEISFVDNLATFLEF